LTAAATSRLLLVLLLLVDSACRRRSCSYSCRTARHLLLLLFLRSCRTACVHSAASHSSSCISRSIACCFGCRSLRCIHNSSSSLPCILITLLLLLLLLLLRCCWFSSCSAAANAFASRLLLLLLRLPCFVLGLQLLDCCLTLG
jgi:hypothetical protein